MAKDDDGLTARPGDDPYELDWPDDAKDARAQERENAAKAAAVAPVGRNIAAVILGLGLVILCVMPLAVVSGQVHVLLGAVAPIVVAGLVVGFPTWWLLDRVTGGMPRGIPEVAFLIVGGAVGYGLTWAWLELLRGSLGGTDEDFVVAQSQSSIFMMTASAVGFVGAYVLADRLRQYPKQVKILGALVLTLFLASVFAYLFVRPA